VVEQAAVPKAKKEVALARIERRKYSDRKQYLIRAVHKRRKKVRSMAVEYKGGKCERCGYNRCIDALEFHHADPTQKDFNISSKGYTRSWKRVQAELDKCVMLCANCHRETHAKLAASVGNNGVKSGLNQGNLNPLSVDTAILS
jgi:hypothetical protein